MSNQGLSNNSIATNVKNKVMRFSRGKVFTTESLKVEGSPATIQRALSRLVAQGELQRVHKGVYYKPEIGTLIKKPLPPNVNQAIEVITKHNGEKTQVHGAWAANKLGLSTQVPMIKVFYTSGSSREIEVAGSRVKFIHTRNKALLESKDPLVGMAVSAMHYLGKDAVNPQIVERIKQKMSQQEFEKLKSLKLAGWMKSAIQKVA